MSEVIVEKLFTKNPRDNKVIKPTTDLVNKIVDQAELDDGIWVLKMPRKIRKRSKERFYAIRKDFLNGELHGIRIRCKPAGNDSCFEWTLVPPAHVDVEVAYSILQRVDKNLKIYDTVITAASLMMPEIREGQFDTLSVMGKTPLKKPTPLFKQAEQYVEKQKLTLKEVSTHVSPEENSIKNKTYDSKKMIVDSLAITESTTMSNQEVLDKALVAMSFVTDRFEKKNIISKVIIENLEIKDFCEKYSKGMYSTKPSVMRALMMSLRKNNYIETDSSTCAFTEKAKNRIRKIQEYLSLDIRKKIKINFNEEDFYEKPVVNEESKTSDDFFNSNNMISELKKLIKNLEDASAQVEESKSLIFDLENEQSDFSIQLAGISVTFDRLFSKKEEIEKEIEKLKLKEKEIENKISKNKNEIKEWESFKRSHEIEKEKIEEKITKITGRNKIVS